MIHHESGQVGPRLGVGTGGYDAVEDNHVPLPSDESRDKPSLAAVRIRMATAPSWNVDPLAAGRENRRQPSR